MKRKIALIVLIIPALLLTGCGSKKEVETLNGNISTLVAEINLMKEDIEDLKRATGNVDLIEGTLTDPDGEPQYDADGNLIEQKQSGNITVKVTEKISKIKGIDDVEENGIEIHAEITNNTNKEVKGVQGILDIQDMFGASILRVDCSLIENPIAPKSKGAVNNAFIKTGTSSTYTKAHEAESKDLIFVYTVKKVAFADGSFVEIGK